MNFETMSKQRKMVLISAAIGIISMFLPWVKIVGLNGMRDWGIIVFLGFVVAAAMCLMGDQTKNLTRTNWMITLIAGSLALLILLISFLNSMSHLSWVNYGFYGAWAGAVGVASYTYMNRSPGDTVQNGFDSLKNSFGSKVDTPSSGNNANPTKTPTSHTAANDPTRPTV